MSTASGLDASNNRYWFGLLLAGLAHLSQGWLPRWLPAARKGVMCCRPSPEQPFQVSSRVESAAISSFVEDCWGSHWTIVSRNFAAFIQVGSSQSEEIWMRARVLAVVNGNDHVNFCDMGKLATMKRVYKFPEELAPFFNSKSHWQRRNQDSAVIQRKEKV